MEKSSTKPEVIMDAETSKRIEDILYCVSMECSISTEDIKLLCWAAGVQFPPRRIEPLQREVAFEIEERQRLDWMDQKAEMRTK